MPAETPQSTDAIASRSVSGLLADLAAKTPSPGGGAAAGVLGATGAATAGMVVAYSIGRKSLSEHADRLADAAERLEAMRGRFLKLADEDATAYAALNALQKLDEDDPTRLAEEPGALRRAINVPRAGVALAAELLTLCESLCGITNPWLKSDLAIGAIAAEAAHAAAACNVRINAASLPDAERDALLAEVDGAEKWAREARVGVERRCR